jgi:hypothetical protein
MPAPVFISHSSRDRAVAATLCEALERRGVACWISSRDIVAGANFQESIVQAVRAARVMVLVFTSNANNSDEIKKELALAGQHRLAVIPVRVEDVLPNDAFSYEFATRQWIDLFGDWDRAVGRLVDQVERMLGQPADPADLPRASPLPRRLRLRLILMAMALVSAAVTIGLVALDLGRTPPPVAVAPAPAVPPGRLGHYSAADGLSGFVLDRSGAVPRLRFDGSAEIIVLGAESAPLGDTAFRRADGDVLLRIDPAGRITLFDAAHGDGTAATRDADATPLPAR